MKKFILGNQDIDTSFVTLEMTWAGVLNPRIDEQTGMVHPATFEEIVNGKTINTYINDADFKDFVDRCSKVLVASPKLLEKLKLGTVKSTKKIRDFAIKYKSRVNSLTSQEMAFFLKQVKDLQIETLVYGTVVAWADIFGGITGPLIEIVQKRKSLKYPVYVYSNVLSTPRQKSLTEQAYKVIVTTSKKDSNLAKEFFWLDQGYVGRGLTLSQIKNIRESHEEKDPVPIYNSLIKELNLTKQEMRRFQVSQDVIFIKSLRADSRQFIHVVINQMIDRLAQKWSIESRLLETLSSEEIGACLQGRLILPGNLKNRWKHSVLLPQKGGGYTVLMGKKAQVFVDKNFKKTKQRGATVVKGQIAHGGKAIGEVKLVFGPQHLRKVNEGDILISVSTSPQLLPAMKKAAAFITDVGGITSHAAIVSRELGKPCIVGTKVATQVFKDGDKVEVDANKGIVRKL